MIPFMVDEGKVIDSPPDEIWIRRGDQPIVIGNSAARVLAKFGYVKIAAIGPVAVNQAVKGICIARNIMWEDNECDIACFPYFSSIEDAQGDGRTRIMFHLSTVTYDGGIYQTIKEW